jgi:branched-chain amino acid aminotransferase
MLAARRFGVTDHVVHGVHEYEDDPRNDAVLVYVNGELKRRDEAVVSVFDSGFVLGDGVWEGLRVHVGHPVFLDQHLDRLYEGAKAIALDVGLSRHDLRSAIYRTLHANGMSDGVHVRLMVTRGVKRTPYQDPRVTVGPATVVIIPEFKQPSRALLDTGIRLFTVHVRRPYPDVLDPKLNTHGKTSPPRISALPSRSSSTTSWWLPEGRRRSSTRATSFSIPGPTCVRCAATSG